MQSSRIRSELANMGNNHPATLPPMQPVTQPSFNPGPIPVVNKPPGSVDSPKQEAFAPPGAVAGIYQQPAAVYGGGVPDTQVYLGASTDFAGDLLSPAIGGPNDALCKKLSVALIVLFVLVVSHFDQERKYSWSMTIRCNINLLIFIPCFFRLSGHLPMLVLRPLMDHHSEV